MIVSLSSKVCRAACLLTRFAIVAFEFSEDECRQDGPGAEDQQCLLQTVYHHRRTSLDAVGEEKRRDQRGHGDTETDRHCCRCWR